MPKYVIETVRVLRTKYYVDVPNPEWACDSIVMEELDQFSDVFHMEDIASVTEVEEWPVASDREGVNGAVNIYTFKEGVGDWVKGVRWDLDPRHPLRNEK